jgi:decaprenylphospho-beta-D-erythro-pentofuranosid-2-ulose 2-reductase
MMGAMSTPRILIVGATSGVAQALASAFARRGYELVLAARDETRLAEIARDLAIRANSAAIPCMRFDAADTDSHAALAEAVLGLKIDGCVIACGAMFAQEDCETDFALCERTIAANYLGLVSICNQLVAGYRERGHGFISCITSVAGDRGRQSNFVYGSSKAGMSAYLEGLRNRLHPEGILIQTIKLGPVDTPMNIGVERTPFMISAERAAESIVASLEKRRDVAYIPLIWLPIMAIIRLLPTALFKRLKL